MLKELLVENLVDLRRELHANPELSGDELLTAQRIKVFIKKFIDVDFIEFSGSCAFGILIEGENEGSKIILRADIDALPIQEKTGLDYSSKNLGVMHACGHDGHASILAGLAILIHNKGLKNGKLLLIFQGEEETGLGASKILKSKEFNNEVYDYSYALHNYPGFDKKTVYCKSGCIAAASIGVIVNIEGSSSHSGESNCASTPVHAFSHLLDYIDRIETNNDYSDYVLANIVYANIGNKSFGITPCSCLLMASLSAFEDKDLSILCSKLEKEVEKSAKPKDLNYDITYAEDFQAAINCGSSVKILEESLDNSYLKYVELNKPFTWSEDFSEFLAKNPGALFIIGSGKDSAKLHSPNYDFPDSIIEDGLEAYTCLVDKLCS